MKPEEKQEKIKYAYEAAYSVMMSLVQEEPIDSEKKQRLYER